VTTSSRAKVQPERREHDIHSMPRFRSDMIWGIATSKSSNVSSNALGNPHAVPPVRTSFGSGSRESKMLHFFRFDRGAQRNTVAFLCGLSPAARATPSEVETVRESQ
jgi:hypothetical protein